MNKLNYAFTDNNDQPVFAIPLVSNVKYFDSKFKVLILAIVTDKKGTSIISFDIISNMDELLKKYILKYPDNLVIYGSDEKGAQTFDLFNDSPTILKSDFPNKLFSEEYSFKILNSFFEDKEVSTSKCFYLKDSNNNQIIKVCEKSYCLIAYPISLN